MALQIKDQSTWEKFFLDANVPKKDSTIYAKIFVSNRITGELLPDLTKGTLQELGIDILGDCLAILRHARSLTVTPSVVTQPTPIKAPVAKLPQINTDMTLQQFRKFLIDWNVFKQITGVTGTQITTQLYSCCDDPVQNSLVNTISDIFSVDEKALAGCNQIDGHQTVKSNGPSYELCLNNPKPTRNHPGIPNSTEIICSRLRILLSRLQLGPPIQPHS